MVITSEWAADAIGIGPAAGIVTAEDVSYPSGKELVSAPPVVQDMGRSGGVFADLDSIVVEVGDLVFIRYNEQPDRRLSIRLSDSENNPSDGLVHVSQPLGTAILGASLDEEVTVRVGQSHPNGGNRKDREAPTCGGIGGGITKPKRLTWVTRLRIGPIWSMFSTVL